MNQFPLTVQQVAVSRIRDTLQQQKEVFEKIRIGRPMDAETNEARKIAFIKRKVGVTSDVAEQIAAYKDPSTLPLSAAKISKAESLQGPTVDFMSISFLDVARAASRSIARVVFADGRAQGSGFMVSPVLFLTNQHVFQNAEQAKGFLLEFNYELDFRSIGLEPTVFKLDPDRFFLSSDETDLDYALVAIGPKVSGPLEHDDIGFLPMINNDDKQMKSIFVNCIQHPDGNPKQLVVRENRLTARTPNTLIYSSDTLPGSSGSPVCNDDWEVIALHHYGGPYRAIADRGDDAGLPLNGNEGIRISSIMKNLHEKSTGLTGEKKLLLTEALSYTFRQPSLMLKQQVLNRFDKNYTYMQETHQNGTTHTMPVATAANGSVSVTVPLTVTLTIGHPQAVASSSQLTKGADEPPNGAEKLVPDSNYKNRKGYQANFLGVVVPLPKLSEHQKEHLAARNLQSGAGDDPFEFKYQHFSIFMNGKRKLAFFTAVNIDGASVVKINRQTGRVTRGPEAAEAREKWYDDERIDKNEVCHDDLYRDPEMRDFQRGHLVKRTDPSWGTEAKALKAQADTFHFLNCAQQHEDFNPNTTRWAGVENWITNKSDNENIRVSVFSGPVFEDNDPEYADLRVPKSFWKVIAWVEDGTLMSTGILATQAMLLKSGLAPEALMGRENFSELPDKLPVDYRVSIAYLQEITKLDFGKLVEADTFSTDSEAMKSRPFYRISSMEALFPGFTKKVNAF
jgi:endonuclease G